MIELTLVGALAIIVLLVIVIVVTIRSGSVDQDKAEAALEGEAKKVGGRLSAWWKRLRG